MKYKSKTAHTFSIPYQVLVRVKVGHQQCVIPNKGVVAKSDRKGGSSSKGLGAEGVSIPGATREKHAQPCRHSVGRAEPVGLQPRIT